MNLILLWQWELEAALRGDHTAIESECDDQGTAGGIILRADDRRAQHITGVLRPEPGSCLRVGILGDSAAEANTHGNVGSIARLAAEILSDGRVRLAVPPESIGAALRDAFVETVPEAPHVEVILATPSPAVLLRLWFIFAQLGVRRVFLTDTALPHPSRTEKSYFASHATHADRYMPELVKGLEQSVATTLPVVRVKMRLKPLLRDTLDGVCPSGILRLVHIEPDASDQDGGSMDAPRIADVVARATTAAAGTTAQPQGILLAIGPEVGWGHADRDLFREHNFFEVSFGRRRCTTEVAVTSLITLAADALEEHAR